MYNLTDTTIRVIEMIKIIMKSNKISIFAICAVMLLISVTAMSAKNKCVPKLYAFGIASSFNDSIVYVTEVQEIDSAWINEKNKFLIGRDNYSYQLKQYFENKGMPHRTCCICFNLKKKDIDKKYKKIIAHYQKKGLFKIKEIKQGEFHFLPIKPEE